MQRVLDPDVEGTGLRVHHDRSVSEPGLRAQHRQDRAAGQRDGREHRARDERHRLAAQRIVEHPDVCANQCVFHAAHQEPVSADVQPGGRSTHIHPRGEPNRAPNTTPAPMSRPRRRCPGMAAREAQSARAD